jgi:hypothetical protein
VLRCYSLHDGVERVDVADIDAAVGEGCAKFGFGALLDAGEVGGGGFEAVEGVDWDEGISRSSPVPVLYFFTRSVLRK